MLRSQTYEILLDDFKPGAMVNIFLFSNSKVSGTCTIWWGMNGRCCDQSVDWLSVLGQLSMPVSFLGLSTADSSGKATLAWTVPIKVCANMSACPGGSTDS